MYLLLRKLYGRWAGLVGIVVIMSSPVVVTTWGSDYSSSAAISYMTGGLAALALSWEEHRWARFWLLGLSFFRVTDRRLVVAQQYRLWAAQMKLR